jgi:hypothetical protein
MNRIKRFIKKHKYLFLFIQNTILPFREFYLKYLISDEKLLKKLYKKKLGKELNLKNPKTFNEKLQYLKLVQKDEKFSILSDKYRVREYVKEKIGEDYLIPLLWHGENPKDIPWEKLPNKFVIKTNHDSGSAIIVTDKKKIDKKWVEKELKYRLKVNYYLKGREYNYKNIPKKIIIEKLLGENINDYKFFCFDGIPKFMFIATDRGNLSKGGTKFDFYDLNMNRIKVKQHYPNSTYKFKIDEDFYKMIELAKKLSQDFKHVRVDFYKINNQIFFGEMTFYHFSGFEKFEPEKYDRIFGEYIKLGD